MTDHPISRRTFGIAGLAVAGAALVGCGSSSGTDAVSGAGVRVKHAFGTTEVPQPVERVVSVGYTEQDFLLALGVTPVGVTDWYGDQPYAAWPWAREALGSAKPKLLTLDDGFQFTEIAALEPDLIIGVNAGMEKSDYSKLSAIAPTIGPAKADEGYFAPWNDMLTPIAAAVGKPEEGAALEKSIRGQFAQAAAKNAVFQGKKAIFLQNAVYDGSLIAYQQGLSTDFLTDLGLEVPTEIDEFVREAEQAYIPVERISVLNAADVLVWGTESDADRPALEKTPGFSDLEPVKAGRSLYTGGELAGAIYFSSPLSLPYVVDELVPQLADAFA